MSLGDELRYLRAFHGGEDLESIEETTGIPQGTIRMWEQRYRRVGEDDEMLARLADYYSVPLEELKFHRERYRKALSAILYRSEEEGHVVRLKLRTGEKMVGRVRWWDLGSFGLEREEGEFTVVQRHAVIDWEGSE
jgi:transcriptional regulator with XRE-family HTH domain